MDGDILLTPYTNKNDQGVSLVASGLLACVSKPQDCQAYIKISLCYLSCLLEGTTV